MKTPQNHEEHNGLTIRIEFPWPVKQTDGKVVEVEAATNTEFQQAVDLATERLAITQDIPEGRWSDQLHDEIFETALRIAVLSRIKVR